MICKCTKVEYHDMGFGPMKIKEDGAFARDDYLVSYDEGWEECLE